MYHIKNDKRSITSANALYNALINDLHSETLKDVSITSLVKQAQVGRSTFYRNFDEPLDILKWKCDSSFREVMERFNHKRHQKAVGQLDFIHDVFEYWEQNYEVLESLIANKRIDIIQNASAVITDYLKEVDDPLPIGSTYYQYAINLRISILVGMMITWIEHGRKESATEITQILLKNLKEIPNMPILY